MSRCDCCGATDRLRPDRIDPDLPDISLNRQTLCVDCFIGKQGTNDRTDWRTPPEVH